jgi:hypothetical protein
MNNEVMFFIGSCCATRAKRELSRCITGVSLRDRWRRELFSDSDVECTGDEVMGSIRQKFPQNIQSSQDVS